MGKDSIVRETALLVVVTSCLVLWITACGNSNPAPTPDPQRPVDGVCGFSASTNSQTIDATAREISVAVNAQAGCSWTAVSEADFIRVVEPAGGNGTGNGTVRLSIGSNPAGQRVGTAKIAGVTFTYTQQAAPCAFALTGDLNFSAPAGGGTGRVTVAVTQGASCQWTATSNNTSFITLTSAASGTDNGTVTFSVAANTGSARTGTLTVAGQTITVNQASSSSPSIGSIVPTSAVVGSFSLTINGSGFDPGLAEIAVVGGACSPASPCLVTNAELTTRTANQLAGPLTLRAPGAFTVQVRNGSSGALSNAVSLTVATGPTPTITNITPTTVTGGTFSLTLNGTGFDPSSAQFVVIGPGCASPACVVLNSELTTKTGTQLIGPLTVRTAGSFTIQVQNAGSGGPRSNAVTFQVTAAAVPVITTIAPTSVAAGTFSLAIDGSNFDPSQSRLLVTGPGCAACLVLNSEMTTKATTRLVAPLRLGTAGLFAIQVQNGAGGPISNSVTLTVR